MSNKDILSTFQNQEFEKKYIENIFTYFVYIIFKITQSV